MCQKTHSPLTFRAVPLKAVRTMTMFVAGSTRTHTNEMSAVLPSGSNSDRNSGVS